MIQRDFKNAASEYKKFAQMTQTLRGTNGFNLCTQKPADTWRLNLAFKSQGEGAVRF